jgi:hypothetical protein
MILRFSAVALALTVSWGTAAARDEPPPIGGQPPTEAGVNIEARGQIHEAFAQPWDPVVNPTAIIHKQPPDPIAEEPPDQRPSGKNVQWIPGYWQWDDDRKDFIWVSGIWRDYPEGRHWVVGHWTAVADGWYRVLGHWASDQEPDFQYVQKPPEPRQEVQPTAPDVNSIWIPGSWFFAENGWRWRAGYYTEARVGYVWQPACYCWSPNGYIFCSGYWDYDPLYRGLVFAPVWFERPLWLRAGWRFRPFFALDIGGIWGSLFVRPGWGYYFGDWYGRAYVGLGFRPWYSFGAGHYDPMFAYEHWHHRTDPMFFADIKKVNEARFAGKVALPPHTFSPTMKGPHSIVALNQFHTLKTNVHLEKVTAAQRTAIIQHAQVMHEQRLNLSHGNFPSNLTTNLHATGVDSKSFYPHSFQPGAVHTGGFQNVGPIHSSFPGYHPPAGHSPPHK